MRGENEPRAAPATGDAPVDRRALVAGAVVALDLA
jgi:hypothetical protein